MSTVKKLQKIQEALNHMSKAASLVEAAKNIDTFRESTQQIEDAQIEAKAEELFEIYSDKYQEGLSENIFYDWLNQSEHLREGFHAIARHLATPQTDVQHALQAALESERELMDILRKIGKVFGKNVGTDIGILDLPKLVEGELIKTDEDNGGYRGKIDKLLFWLSSHNLTKPGACVTDTIIELLEKAVSPKSPTPQLINASRVMNVIHIKPELRVGMTEDRIIENLEILHRDAAGNFTLENKVSIVKKDPQLHDLITHLPDFHNAVRVRYDIAHSCGDEDEVSYWRRQLDVVNKLLELTK